MPIQNLQVFGIRAIQATPFGSIFGMPFVQGGHCQFDIAGLKLGEKSKIVFKIV